MKAEAWGALHHEKDHILAEGADFRLADLAADGSVSITFKTNRPFDVNGEYYVRLTFTAAEMDKMHRQSLACTAKGLIQPPAPKAAEKFKRISSISGPPPYGRTVAEIKNFAPSRKCLCNKSFS